MTEPTISQTLEASVSTEYKVTSIERLICNCGGQMWVLEDDEEYITNSFKYPVPKDSYLHTCEKCGNTEERSERHPRRNDVDVDKVVRDIVQDELKNYQLAQSKQMTKVIDDIVEIGSRYSEKG